MLRFFMSQQKKKIDLLIADDHELMRTGLQVTLQNLSVTNTIYLAKNGIEALTLLSKHTCDNNFLDYE